MMPSFGQIVLAVRSYFAQSSTRAELRAVLGEVIARLEAELEAGIADPQEEKAVESLIGDIDTYLGITEPTPPTPPTAA